MFHAKIYYTKFTKQLPSDVWIAYLKKLPQNLQERNAKFYRWQDQHSNLFGKLLLLESIKNDFPQVDITQLKLSQYSRPYFEKSNFDFNISHSGQYVLCAIGENMKIGIDVEEIREINFDNFKISMTDEQWEKINSSKTSLKTFFNFWTIKESALKADSRGLSVPLQKLHIIGNTVQCENQSWYFKEILLDSNYSMHFASNMPDVMLKFIEIDFHGALRNEG